MGRTVIVSNRLPLSVSWEGGRPTFVSSSGGLATGLAPIHARGESLWIGWPGETDGLSREECAELESRLARERFLPVFLSARQVEAYYERFSNGTLWPLLHYRIDQLAPQEADWRAYVEVNLLFARAIAQHWREGDLVWVHDYQLLLVPRMLRELRPGARIGFFLHIPFPSAAILRVLPQAREILESLLAADCVGFHTATYARNFQEAELRLAGADVRGDEVRRAGRRTHVGVFPMGIDARSYSALADEKETLEVARKWRKGDKARWLVGIDRLDYTKGIPGRLLAFERLLSEHAELRGKVRFVQVAVPSRGGVEAYQRFRRLIEELIGNIQGTFGIPDWTPVRYLHRSLSRRDVVALYRAADVLLVTPVRDGMNLVAKEFVASRNDEDGVLLLSEFAGASQELPDAVPVNPYDVAGSAQAILEALNLSRDERRARMKRMRARVFEHDGASWAQSFLDTLGRCGPAPGSDARSPHWIEQARAARELRLLLDYDGTLVDFHEDPAAAQPDAPLLELLQQLAERPHTQLHVVSGRSRADLERWLGDLPLHLHAEHGLWSRRRGAGQWQRLPVAPLPARAAVRGILEELHQRLPGSRVEEKEEALVFHWRASEARVAERQVHELELTLRVLVGGEGLRIQRGDRVLEVRHAAGSKSLAALAARENGDADALLVAIGDDATDEDMFAEVLPQGVAVKVGGGESCADARLEDVAAVRKALAGLLG
jgi:trehalose 6-phosphate synthase/phosphatase